VVGKTGRKSLTSTSSTGLKGFLAFGLFPKPERHKWAWSMPNMLNTGEMTFIVIVTLFCRSVSELKFLFAVQDGGTLREGVSLAA